MLVWLPVVQPELQLVRALDEVFALLGLAKMALIVPPVDLTWSVQLKQVLPPLGIAHQVVLSTVQVSLMLGLAQVVVVLVAVPSTAMVRSRTKVLPLVVVALAVTQVLLVPGIAQLVPGLGLAQAELGQAVVLPVVLVAVAAPLPS